MKARFVDLKPSVDALRAYVPVLQESESNEYSGTFKSVRFGKLFVNVQRDEKYPHPTPSLNVAYSRVKHGRELVIPLFDNAVRLLRGEAAPGRDEAKSHMVVSPFVENFLYYNAGIKISMKAHKDLYHFMRAPFAIKKWRFDLKDMLAQLLLAVYALHRDNLVHRDIKPENILVYLLEDGSIHLKLTDFDSVDLATKNKMTFCGTLDYLAPELFDVKNKILLSKESYWKTDKKAIDCFALGLTMQKFLALYKSHSQSSEANADVAEFDTLVRGLLRADPGKRYTIEQAMDRLCFGQTKKERDEYFASIIKKYKNNYLDCYDNYCRSPEDSYPQKADAFLILPAHLKEIYQLAASLDDCVKSYADLPSPCLIKAIDEKSARLLLAMIRCQWNFLECPHDVFNKLKMDVQNIRSSLIESKVQMLMMGDLQHIVNSAILEYERVNNISPGRVYSFFDLHTIKGVKQAKQLSAKMEKCISEGGSPKQVFNIMYDHLQYGAGGDRETSFKTLLRKKLQKVSELPLDQWAALMSSDKTFRDAYLVSAPK